ncbi:MAG: hypothetical protein ACYS8Z_27110, partial [Planctomycetota bacterium]
MMSKRDKAKKLGPIEVLVVLLVCLFVIAIIGPAAQVSRFEDYRIQCGTNLSNIGKAMLIYANDYDDELPRSGGRNSIWAPTIRDWKASDRFGAYDLLPNGTGGQASISSCFYLLVKYAEVTPRTFVCPGDVGTTEFTLAEVDTGFREMIDLWDFGPEPSRHCSYAYHMPFSMYALTTSSEPGMAIAADRNPWMDSHAAAAKEYPGIFMPDGLEEHIEYGNALAHEEKGQNVLFLDIHVGFEEHSFCGIHDDNIYTHWDGGDIRYGAPPIVGSEPMDRVDSLLVHDPISPSSTTITKEPEAIDSADLEQTSIVATLDSPLPEYHNVIWCSTFQMAWDILKNYIIGEPVEVPDAQELADRLNSAEFPDKDLEYESYFATAGLLAEGIIEEILDEMAYLFPSEPEPVFDDLNADIELEHPFHISNYEFDFQDSNGVISEVISFCSHSRADSSDLVREQVDVLYYKHSDQPSDTEFAVDLCIHTNPYKVVLACVPRQNTLGETVAFVEQKISEFKQDPDYEQVRKLQPAVRGGRFGEQPAETLIVPDVLYKLTHHFTEVENKAIANQPWLDQGYFISKAIQKTNFTLGRTRNILGSDTEIFASPTGR